MVIVRELPRAKHSPDKNSAQWPPKSPYEALVSSPSGKKRWQDNQDVRQRTPSPSPQRRTQHNGKNPQDVLNQLGDPFESDHDEDGEDEETLKLQLQAIEAKLKLKKLKQARERRDAGEPSGFQDPVSVQGSPRRKRPRLEVPVSPIRTNTAPPVNKSPARVLLGIDKGLKADQVSLKRARPTAATNKAAVQKAPLRVKSFTERLVESRASEIQQREKTERINNARGTSFGLANIASSTPSASHTKHSTVSAAPSQPSLLESARKKSASSTAPAPSLAGPANITSASSRQSTAAHSGKSKRPMSTEDALALEPYSGLHLSKRTLPATDLSTALEGKELYPLPRLLKEIKSPTYEPPDCESDYVVFGIIASKSSPHDTKTAPSTRGAGSSTDPHSTEKKFLVLKLTDLKWEIDLFLFSTAFANYWKLSPGTLIAVLNPGIMPPRPHARDTGRFSLKLSSSDDGVLELGTARDLGFCASLKRDGQLCNAWINSKKAEHCDFHMNMVVDKQRAKRMDVNTVFRYTGTKDKRGRDGSTSPPSGRPGYFNSYSRAPPPDKDGGEGAGKYRRAQKRDWETGEAYFMGPAPTTKLLDNEDVVAPEKMRKRLAEKERERELGEKLGRLGKGLGAEYLRAGAAKVDNVASAAAGMASAAGSKNAAAAALDDDDPDWELKIGHEVKPDAISLGLVRSSSDVRLSPVRGRRKMLHEQGEAMGWSGAFKRGVLEHNISGVKRTLSPEKKGGPSTSVAGRDASPKKKARFVIANKGIREPGRDSLGDAVGQLEDSDDDLDII